MLPLFAVITFWGFEPMQTQAEYTAERIESLKEQVAAAKSKGHKVDAMQLQRLLDGAVKRQKLEGFTR